MRLALAAERIFSHVNVYQQPKLNSTSTDSLITVYNLHSCAGRDKPIWVYGILTKKQDERFYLEDCTASIKLDFSELEYADPQSYFTENCVLLCLGKQQESEFVVTEITHPPMHFNKSLRFKLKQDDYFGAYNKTLKEFAKAPV